MAERNFNRNTDPEMNCPKLYGQYEKSPLW